MPSIQCLDILVSWGPCGRELLQGREEMDSGVLLHPGHGPVTKHQCSALPESPPHPAFLMAELEMVVQDGQIRPAWSSGAA